MTEQEKTKRKEDERVKWIKKNLVNKDSGKDYVFVSYKSDDWEKVLGEIVYPLMKEHGLNVYFDGDFDLHNDNWIKQFPENQADEHCKGVLCFFSNKYFKSYATLLEVMNATCCSKKIIPVSIETIYADYENDTGNTGLGQEDFNVKDENGVAHKSKNYFWKLELKKFNELYKELKEKLGNRIRGFKPFDEEDEEFLEPCTDSAPLLTIRNCGKIMSELLQHSAVNLNDGSNTDIIQSTVGKLKDTAGESVFTSDHSLKPYVSTEAKPSSDRFPDARTSKLIFTPFEEKSEIGELSLKDFIDKYNDDSFKRDSFDELSFVAMDKDGNNLQQYDVESVSSTATLSWKLLMKMLERLGNEYIEFVNDKNKNKSNPLFVRTEEKNNYKVSYKATDHIPEWSMCTNYSQYTWLTILKNRLDELRSFYEWLHRDNVNNDEKILPRPLLSSGSSNDSVTKNEGKNKKTSLSDMIESGILTIGDEVYVKGKPDKSGIITGGNEISYNGQKFSLNKFVPEVLGPGSRNAYDYVYHKKTNKTLNELRPENN